MRLKPSILGNREIKAARPKTALYFCEVESPGSADIPVRPRSNFVTDPADRNVRAPIHGGCVNRKSSFVNPRAAFTLVEMLVVLAIIGIMAAMILPNLGSLTKSHAMTTASRQMLDDIAYARQKAISDHTTVYMVFIPPEFWTDTRVDQILQNGNAAFFSSKEQLTNAILGQCTSYALFVPRTVGDQPGNPRSRYITDWRNLPEGVLIETNKFEINPALVRRSIADVNDPATSPRAFNVTNFLRADFPFPSAQITNTVSPAPVFVSLPYIAFNSQGRLGTNSQNWWRDQPGEFIPLASGSILHPRDANERLKIGTADAVPDIVQKQYVEATRTNYNLIYIDGLTGRAKLERPELR